MGWTTSSAGGSLPSRLTHSLRPAEHRHRAGGRMSSECEAEMLKASFLAGHTAGDDELLVDIMQQHTVPVIREM